MPYTLLVADGNATTRRLVELIFADPQAHVIAAADLDTARARVEDARPDVVLAGVQEAGRATTEVDGYELCSFIKSRPHLAHIPVVLLSGPFAALDAQRVRMSRCDDVLEKPWDPAQMVARVEHLVGRVRLAPDEADRPAGGLPIASGEVPQSEDVDALLERLDTAFSRLKHASTPPRPPVTFAGPPPSSGPEEPGPFAPSTSAQSALEAREPAEEKPAAAVPPDPQLVDAVTRLVVERLGQEAVRDLAAEVLHGVAERLVREEIARIREEAER